MRHLLTAIAVVILGSIGWVILADKSINHTSGTHHNDTSDEETVMAIEPDESVESSTEDDYVYYGDTLYQYDGKTIVIDYSEQDSGISSMSSSQIVTYVDTTPMSRSRIVGNGNYFVDGPVLKFAIGVDTVRYDMRKLPKTLNPGKTLLPADVVEHSYARSFALSDSSWNCDFKFLAYLPKNHPAWSPHITGL